MTNNIILATQSEIKVNCVKTFFSDCQLEIKTISTKTDYVQPIGHDQARHCLTQRMEQAKAAADANTYLTLAIENFVFNEGTVFYDACMVAMQRLPQGEIQFTQIIKSQTVEVPAILNDILFHNEPSTVIEQVGGSTGDRSMRSSRETLKTTCGDLLREHYGENPLYSDKDWFMATGNAFNRTQQINMVLQGSPLLGLVRNIHR